METDNKKTVGYIGIGIFLILVYQKLYVILEDTFEKVFLIFDFGFLVILILSDLSATIFCLFLLYFSLKKITKLSDITGFKVKRTILQLALIYFLIMIVFGYLQSYLIDWIINRFSLLEKETTYISFRYKNYFTDRVVSASVWTINIVAILLIFFREIKIEEKHK